jgi:hypothetical protein
MRLICGTAFAIVRMAPEVPLRKFASPLYAMLKATVPAGTNPVTGRFASMMPEFCGSGPTTPP